MANKKITELMAGTPVRDSLLESVVDINGTLESRKVKAGAVADLASANVAAPYDSTVTYAIGQFCLYEGDIYRCIAITTGAFDSTAWTQIVVTGEFRRVVELTSAQYSALSSAEKNNGTLYVITDEETTADDIPYSQGVSVADKLDNVPTFDTLTSSDNNKLLGVSVSGSDISVVAVDKTYDSGWQPITLPSGFTQLSYIGAQARRIGDIVYIKLGVENTSVVPTFTVVGTVPVSMKPLIEVNVCGRCMNDIALFSINRNTGAISFLASPSASGAKQFMLCISYPVT